jgi:hypothetical protein
MTKSYGLTQGGLALALDLRQRYRSHQPLMVQGGSDRLLMPEHLLNRGIDLQDYEDPLPLAMVATRDPDSPMSVAAAVRLSPQGRESRLIGGVFEMLGATSKHPVVKQMVDLITESDFAPEMIDKVQRNAEKFVSLSRKRYADALRKNLKALLDGELDPRRFVAEFFELSEAGNLRVDIRKRLILGLLTSDTIRPAIKFMFLENLQRLPLTVAKEIIADTLRQPDKPSLEAIKQELAWIKLELKPARLH